MIAAVTMVAAETTAAEGIMTAAVIMAADRGEETEVRARRAGIPACRLSERILPIITRKTATATTITNIGNQAEKVMNPKKYRKNTEKLKKVLDITALAQ